ncbi:MAG: carboxypeptidase M32 [Nitrososphaerales archaeon]
MNEKYRPIWAIASSSALLGWDLEVNLPEKGTRSRGIASAEMALLRQQKMNEISPLIEKAANLKDLNADENGLVRVLVRAEKYYRKIPPELLEEEQRITVEATVVWRDARKKSDFKLFLPHLEKIVALNIKIAEKLGYEKHPYDALLDLGEEGLTVSDTDSMFSRLIPKLKRIFEKVRSESKFPSSHPLEKVKYDTVAMSRVDRKLTEILDMPNDRFRMDVSTHPFMTRTSRDDVRITTRFEGSDFARSMFSTIHESGHAIYELQLNEKFNYSPLGQAVSNGFHESQSRFWENIVGRSRGFISLSRPMLVKELPFVEPYNVDGLYGYFNMVRPSLIRVDADELTYNFHIALRYEIEKMLINGEVPASELPLIWSEKIKDYLGLSPNDDSEGVLQDIHWSAGLFGYFPSYSLGNVIAGVIWHNLCNDIDLEEASRNGNFAPIKMWLYEKIHKYGSAYSPKELVVKSFGEGYNPDRLVEYLENKYLS